MSKHLSFEERIRIEENLDKGISIHKIALELGRPDSSIAREIKRNRYRCTDSGNGLVSCLLRRSESCKQRNRCGNMDCNRECSYCFGADCDNSCPDFVPVECPYLKKAPFVCNGCNKCMAKTRHCFKYKYSARKAEISYRDTLVHSREGISITPEQLNYVDELVSSLIKKGQSVNAVFAAHKDDIPFSASTLYKYIDQCYLDARNIDLARKVRFKKRYDHGPRPESFQTFVAGRTYQDFERYISENEGTNIWEMDTVIGTPGGKVLLTLLFRRSSFMLAFLLEKHTQECVIHALNDLCDMVGIDTFRSVFQVILTDRGTEFGNPAALECDSNGEIKTCLFYCDPYCSWQKGMIEKNHELIRMILPKGRSFDRLTQKEIHLMMIHINNYPRKSLNNVSPYELTALFLGKELLQKLKHHKLRPDDVILTPKLLRRPTE